MEHPQGIYYMYKRLGETPLEALERLRAGRQELQGVPMTYAGRLDPMAEGVLIALAGEARFRREEFLKLPKEYEFEVLWGIATDTYDLLGMPQLMNNALKDHGDAVRAGASQMIGAFEQEYPPYSSKTVLGRPLFMWAREGRLGEIEMPKRQVEIYSLEIISDLTIKASELNELVSERIACVKGDFRQEKIINEWKSVLERAPEGGSFKVTKMRASVSSGAYVRGIAFELGKRLAIGALALSILRTKIGIYTHEGLMR